MGSSTRVAHGYPVRNSTDGPRSKPEVKSSNVLPRPTARQGVRRRRIIGPTKRSGTVARLRAPHILFELNQASSKMVIVSLIAY